MIRVVTPWYIEASDYFEALAESVSLQTMECQWVLCVSKSELVQLQKMLKSHHITAELRIYPEHLENAIEKRQWLYNYLLQKYDGLLVQVDADDVLDSDRVRCVKEAWVANGSAALYMSRLRYLENYQSDVMNLPAELSSPFDLSLSNCVGLSHVTFNVPVLRKLFPNGFNFCNQVTALDWLLAVQVLARGGRIILDPGMVYYRVYAGNVAGSPRDGSLASKDRAHRVRTTHYDALVNDGLGGYTPVLSSVSHLKSNMSGFARGNWSGWWWSAK